ncbi:MAG: lysine--tRNA ligase [Polyangiaceae bacterium]|nr:lysine--tRNA ligase [Polyangiaceae bacterium]
MTDRSWDDASGVRAVPIEPGNVVESNHGAPEVGGSGEEALAAARRVKAARIRADGRNPFANDAELGDRAWVHALRTSFASALLEPKAELRYDAARVAELAGAAEVHVAGRLTARRGFGKAVFLRLVDASGELQLFAKLDVMKGGFSVLEELDVGDHVEARGVPMVTKTGELSLLVSSLRLLTKALRPLPEKWHGLTDVDIRYRRRYVDLVANPEVASVFRARTLIVQGLRRFLDDDGFVEVETPTLNTVVGGAAARPFHTHHNTLDLPLFLRIAPELYLKRLLVGGLERVYEIGRCYRNEGISPRHNPEFTILEFYQAYATYETLMERTEALLRSVDQYLERGMVASGQPAIYQRWVEQRPFTLAEPFARVRMTDAIARSVAALGLGPDTRADLERRAAAFAAAKSADPGAGRDPELAVFIERVASVSDAARKVEWAQLLRGLAKAETDGERTFTCYEYLAEPFLWQQYRSADGMKSLPVFIIDYPFEVSPLARRKDSDPSLTDRFELFVHSRELCNAFSELNDPDDQAARFQEQVSKKRRGAEETMDYDEDYIRALEHGMPPAAGFGLGVDRLVMALAAQESIRDVIAFPLLRPEGTPG